MNTMKGYSAVRRIPHFGMRERERNGDGDGRGGAHSRKRGEKEEAGLALLPRKIPLADRGGEGVKNEVEEDPPFPTALLKNLSPSPIFHAR